MPHLTICRQHARPVLRIGHGEALRFANMGELLFWLQYFRIQIAQGVFVRAE